MTESWQKSKTLYLDGDYRVNWICDGTPRQILFTFMNWTTNPQKDLRRFEPGSGYGTSTARRYDVGIIEIIPSANDWYQGFYPRCQDALIEFLHGHRLAHLRRLGYGSNMGGYGALAHAYDLSLERILAISPQFEIDCEYDPRWAVSANTSLKKKIEQRAPDIMFQAALAYDPVNLDAEHATRIVEHLSPYVPVRRLEVPFAGHPACKALEQAGILPRLVGALIEDGLPQTNVEYNVDVSEVCLLNRVLHALREEDFSKALDLLARRDSIAPNLPSAKAYFHHLVFGRCLKKAGYPHAALKHFDAALARKPGDHAANVERHEVLARTHLAVAEEASTT